MKPRIVLSGVGSSLMLASMAAALSGAGYAVAEAGALQTARPARQEPARNDSERIAAADAKRARKNAKRAAQKGAQP